MCCVNMYIRSGLSCMDAIKRVAKEKNIPKNDVYKEYMHNFNTTETQKLKDKINALKWEEIKETEDNKIRFVSVVINLETGIKTCNFAL